ncbi:unnamed protein product [Periconia digitata]|uniref:Laccase n=1 Tax=Periconia digitata TaxID=1303443 RepID=A0A9W4UD35_9PLEO|nr:unnamed protein product [Periconia digitata]
MTVFFVAAISASILLNAFSNAFSLPQMETNGESILGTVDSPLLEPLEGSSWGDMSLETTNVYTATFSDAVVRRYTFNVARVSLAPDGVTSPMIVVNGAFPGPTIEANWGDIIEVTVNNQIQGPEAGTSIHWHGLLQHDTPFMDGVPSVTQCPIAPGKSFVYRFKADRPGTSWWHGHFAAQTAGGLHGAIVIHGPPQNGAQYDVDIGPVLLSDRYHIDYRTLIQGYLSVPLQLIPSDSNLINGKGTFNCSTTSLPCKPDAGYSKFMFQSGKRHLLRLINSGAEGLQHFTIDNHEFLVVELDFVSIIPFKTNKITLSPGQRANIVVQGTGKPSDAVWMRTDIDPVCATATNPKTRAIILYETADHGAIPNTTATPYTAVGCTTYELSQTTPVYAIAPPPKPATHIDLDITVGVNDTGHTQWYMNGSPFRADINQALLARAAVGDTAFERPEWNVYNFGSNSSVRMLMRNYHISPHPMHLHGHDFWVLAEGHGEWDGSVVNPSNPIRRDTHQVLPMVDDKPGYAVIEWEQDNPGIWAFHCHIFSHSSLGFYINILERQADIQDTLIPNAVTNSCTSWNEYAMKNEVEQPDSGI